MSTIAGRVLDADGNPVPGASVAVSSGPGPVNDIAVVTDVEGRFRLGKRSRLAVTTAEKLARDPPVVRIPRAVSGYPTIRQSHETTFVSICARPGAAAKTPT